MNKKLEKDTKRGRPWDPEAGEHECRKCGARWQARVMNPVQCPRCKSLNWKKEQG